MKNKRPHQSPGPKRIVVTEANKLQDNAFFFDLLLFYSCVIPLLCSPDQRSQQGWAQEIFPWGAIMEKEILRGHICKECMKFSKYFFWKFEGPYIKKYRILLNSIVTTAFNFGSYWSHINLYYILQWKAFNLILTTIF